jgi:hypothetical protein
MFKYFRELLSILRSIARELATIAQVLEERRYAVKVLVLVCNGKGEVFHAMGEILARPMNTVLQFDLVVDPPSGGYIDVRVEGAEMVSIAGIRQGNMSYALDGYIREYRIHDVSRFRAGTRLRVALDQHRPVLVGWNARHDPTSNCL